MKDAVAEPYRKKFIPDFDKLRKKILKCGAVAMNISGSGPSLFARSDNQETAVKAQKIFKEHFDFLGIDSEVYVEKVSNKGAKLLPM